MKNLFKSSYTSRGHVLPTVAPSWMGYKLKKILSEQNLKYPLLNSSVVTFTPCFVIAFMLLSTASFAQETHLDLIVNSIYSNFHYGASEEAMKPHKKMNMGFQAGLSFQGAVSSRWSIVSELYYMRKGGTLKAGNTLMDRKADIRLHTVEIPVMARLHLCDIYLYGGPSVAYNLAGRIKYEAMDGLGSRTDKACFDKSAGNFRRFDPGMQVGAGYIIKFKKRRLAVDVRYAFGMRSVSRDTDRYNRVLNVNLILYKPWQSNPLAKLLSRSKQ